MPATDALFQALEPLRLRYLDSPLPGWLRTLALVWRRRPPAPAWSVQSAQMSGMWDTVVPGMRG